MRSVCRADGFDQRGTAQAVICEALRHIPRKRVTTQTLFFPIAHRKEVFP